MKIIYKLYDQEITSIAFAYNTILYEDKLIPILVKKVNVIGTVNSLN